MTFASLANVGGGAAVITTIAVSWTVMAFRAENPPIVQAFNDLGFFLFLYTWPFAIWMVILATAIFRDVNPVPIFPRWVAGLDTVTGAIGFCMLKLAQDPTLRARLIENPSLITPFVEEVLRLEGPIPVVPRVNTTDVEVEGVTIPTGSRVLLVLATANRDGYPHELDLTAKPRHFAFGGGIHRCLGSHLSRCELRLTIEEFHARIPDYRLAGTPTLIWPAGTIHLASLPLQFPPS